MVGASVLGELCWQVLDSQLCCWTSLRPGVSLCLFLLFRAHGKIGKTQRGGGRGGGVRPLRPWRRPALAEQFCMEPNKSFHGNKALITAPLGSSCSHWSLIQPGVVKMGAQVVPAFICCSVKVQDRRGERRVVLCASSGTTRGPGEGGVELCSVTFDKVLPFILLLLCNYPACVLPVSSGSMKNYPEVTGSNLYPKI